MKYEVVGPYYFTKKKLPTHVNLVMIRKGDNNAYCWIKYMSRLLSWQIITKSKNYFCNGCLVYFYSEYKLVSSKT